MHRGRTEEQWFKFVLLSARAAIKVIVLHVTTGTQAIPGLLQAISKNEIIRVQEDAGNVQFSVMKVRFSVFEFSIGHSVWPSVMDLVESRSSPWQFPT